MPKYKKNAEDKSKTKTKDVLDKDLELFTELSGMVDDSKDDTVTWRDNSDKFYRLRMRFKKTKTFPFAGCSNLRLPTIEMYIRKIKAAFIAMFANVKPRMQVIPQSDANLEKALRIEKFLDWVVDEKIRLMAKLIIITDRMLENGFSFAKVIWRMDEEVYTETVSLDDLSVEETQMLFDLNTTDEQIQQYIIKKLDVDMSETVQADNMEAVQKAIEELKAGKDEIKILLRDETYNAPEVVPADALSTVAPADSKVDPQQAYFICHEYLEPCISLKKKARAGVLDSDAVDNIDYLKTVNFEKDRIVSFTKDSREGIDPSANQSENVKIWELYTYYDLDEDGIPEKCQFILAPDFHQVLKKQSLPFDHNKFPFVRFNAELIDDRWYSSRGVPEQLEDMSKEIDAQHNQKLDNQTIRNAPMFLFRSGIINPRLVKFMPAQGIPVPGHTPLNDAFQVVNNTNANAEFSYEREEQLLKSVIQEFLGQVDYSLQSMINKRQPRTATESQQQQAMANQVFSLDSTLFLASMTELFTQILELCQQYMPERVFALICGENGVEPIHLTRDEIQGKYSLVCRANDINSNPILKAQKSMGRVQMLLSPIPMQSGVVTPMNVFNILKRYLQDDGEINWKSMITQPQPPPPPPPGVDIVPQFDLLTDIEQAQVLQGRGVKPDMAARELKSNAILEEKERESEAQDVESIVKLSKAMVEERKPDVKKRTDKK